MNVTLSNQTKIITEFSKIINVIIIIYKTNERLILNEVEIKWE